jgi:hypothetical protein
MNSEILQGYQALILAPGRVAHAILRQLLWLLHVACTFYRVCVVFADCVFHHAIITYQRWSRRDSIPCTAIMVEATSYIFRFSGEHAMGAYR